MGAARWAWTALCGAALWAGAPRAAWADDYAAELAPQTSRADAELQLKGHEGAGARVIRRYARGTGWSYFVVIDGLADLDAARKAAQGLAGPDQPATVVLRDDQGAHALEIVTVADIGAGDQSGEASAEKRRKTADDGTAAVLEGAVKAHGGRGEGLERLAHASALRFVFQRTVPADGGLLVAHNVFVREGEAVRLEVSISQGPGKNSVTAIGPDGKAWVSADGAVLSRDTSRTREVLDRFSPEAVLAVPLGLPDDVETAEAWRNLHLVGPVVEDGVNRTVVAPREEGKGGLVSAAFDPQSHTLSRVTWSAEAGQITFRYDDYRRIDKHLVLPFHARVERDGQLVEEVTVESLDLDLPVDLSLFAPPKDSG